MSTRKPNTSKQRCVLKADLQQLIFSGPTATCILSAAGQTFKALVKNLELAELPSSGPVWMSWPSKNGIVLAE